MYASGWVLKFHPTHLRTLGVCTVKGVKFFVFIVAWSSVLCLFFVFQRLIGLVAEVTAASEPNLKKVHPFTGDCCDNLSRKLSDALKSKKHGHLKNNPYSYHDVIIV